MNERQFLPGDQIMTKVQVKNKLAPLFDGPHTVLENRHPVYKISNKKNLSKHHLIHHDPLYPSMNVSFTGDNLSEEDRGDQNLMSHPTDDQESNKGNYQIFRESSHPYGPLSKKLGKNIRRLRRIGINLTDMFDQSAPFDLCFIKK
ncbi:hypothetical protein RF11_00571 [Thelohanellus kitauei]|uniref:Uncharacterized protein n=1 Tax=Thelohanellus kitauei TaxID=669202 RepID=A0A0C2NJK3_THEKT|nr:hypothetical protein RF11_00571 [Thelohanellus kitauei]